MVQAQGEARLAVLTVERESSRHSPASKEMTYRVVLRIDPDVCVTVLGVQEQWWLQTMVRLRLHVHALPTPLAIQLDPAEVNVRSIKVLDATCIEGAGRFNQLNLLSRSIAQPLVEQIRQVLGETERERRIDLVQFIHQALAVRPPIQPASSPIGNKSKTAKRVEGTARSGQAPQYWKMHLKQKQKIELAARWRLLARPNRPVNISLAVCDEDMGLLKSENVVSGATGKIGRGKLSLTVPRSGDYFLRLRLDSWKGDEELEADYQIQVMVT